MATIPPGYAETNLGSSVTIDSRFELDPIDVRKTLQRLGEGHYGEVWMAYLWTTDEQKNRVKVKGALKTIKNSSTLSTRDLNMQIDAIRQEIEIMAHIGEHEYVLRLLGAITKNIEYFCLVTEYCEEGSLQDFLKSKNEQNLYVDEIISNQYENSQGSLYIILHRDLALRNVLLKANFTIKIADFGLARLTKGGLYIMQKNAQELPFAQLAPEVTFRVGNALSLKADWWAFGVLLWEIFHLGVERPFKNQKSRMSVVSFLESGNQLDYPKYAPPEIFEMMRELWMADPEDRVSLIECQRRILLQLKNSCPPLVYQLVAVDNKIQLVYQQQQQQQQQQVKGSEEEQQQQHHQQQQQLVQAEEEEEQQQQLVQGSEEEEQQQHHQQQQQLVQAEEEQQQQQQLVQGSEEEQQQQQLDEQQFLLSTEQRQGQQQQVDDHIGNYPESVMGCEGRLIIVASMSPTDGIHRSNSFIGRLRHNKHSNSHLNPKASIGDENVDAKISRFHSCSYTSKKDVKTETTAIAVLMAINALFVAIVTILSSQGVQFPFVLWFMVGTMALFTSGAIFPACCSALVIYDTLSSTNSKDEALYISVYIGLALTVVVCFCLFYGLRTERAKYLMAYIIFEILSLIIIVIAAAVPYHDKSGVISWIVIPYVCLQYWYIWMVRECYTSFNTKTALRKKYHSSVSKSNLSLSIDIYQKK